MQEPTEEQVVDFQRARLELATDRYLGRLMRFHPDKAVTPDRPNAPVTIIEPTPPPPPPAHIEVVIPLPTLASAAPEVFKYRPPTVRDIIVIVAEFYKIGIRPMLSDRRPIHIVRARQVAIFLCSELTNLSTTVIGRHFRRDHTTALHAIKKIEELRLKDERLFDEIEVLKLHIQQQILNEAA